jgi:hypothetical protein
MRRNGRRGPSSDDHGRWCSVAVPQDGPQRCSGRNGRSPPRSAGSGVAVGKELLESFEQHGEGPDGYCGRCEDAPAPAQLKNRGLDRGIVILADGAHRPADLGSPGQQGARPDQPGVAFPRPRKDRPERARPSPGSSRQAPSPGPAYRLSHPALPRGFLAQIRFRDPAVLRRPANADESVILAPTPLPESGGMVPSSDCPSQGTSAGHLRSSPWQACDVGSTFGRRQLRGGGRPQTRCSIPRTPSLRRWGHSSCPPR